MSGISAIVVGASDGEAITNIHGAEIGWGTGQQTQQKRRTSSQVAYLHLRKVHASRGTREGLCEREKDGKSTMSRREGEKGAGGRALRIDATVQCLVGS